MVGDVIPEVAFGTVPAYSLSLAACSNPFDTLEDARRAIVQLILFYLKGYGSDLSKMLETVRYHLDRWAWLFGLLKVKIGNPNESDRKGIALLELYYRYCLMHSMLGERGYFPA